MGDCQPVHVARATADNVLASVLDGTFDVSQLPYSIVEVGADLSS